MPKTFADYKFRSLIVPCTLSIFVEFLSRLFFPIVLGLVFGSFQGSAGVWIALASGGVLTFPAVGLPIC